jgi:serine/threonine-protein kinase ULK1
MFNDIWSLGIILLNLATGRNPWKSACLNDPTFQAYLQDPLNFIPTVLPISDEANALLTRMLEIDWRDRITIPEIRQALEEVPTFYSEGAIFDGSMARCPWEAGMDIESSSTKKEQSSIMVEESVAYNTGTGSVKPHTQTSVHVKKPFDEYSPVYPRGARAGEPKSHWSIDSTSDIVFANPSSMIDEVSSSAVEDEDDEWVGRPHPASEATWARVEDDEVMLYRPDSPDSILSRSPESPSFPVTPKTSDPYKFATPLNVNGRKLPGLKIDTNCQNLGMRYYANNDPDNLDRSMTSPADSQVMHTALEYDPCSPGLFFPTSSPTKPLPSAIAESTLVSPTFLGTGMNVQMSEWDFDDSEPEAVPVLTRYSSASSFMKGISALRIERSAAPSPDTIVWPELRPLAPTVNHLMSPIRASPLEAFPPRPLSPSQKLFEGIGRIVKPKPKKFFPSQPSSLPSSSSPLTSSSDPPLSKIPPPTPSSYTTDGHDHPLASFTHSEMCTSPVKQKHGTAASSTHSHSPAWINIVSPKKHVRHHSSAHTPTSRRSRNAFRRNHGHSTTVGVPPRRRSRSPRHWFLTTKLFASTGFGAT